MWCISSAELSLIGLAVLAQQRRLGPLDVTRDPVEPAQQQAALLVVGIERHRPRRVYGSRLSRSSSWAEIRLSCSST